MIGKLTILIGLACSLTACRVSSEAIDEAAANRTILLYTGKGTSADDVAALERILTEHHFPYATANSSRLNAMRESDLRRYRLIIVPGGNFVDIGNGLTSNTTAALRDVIRGGTNYLGICAGAFFAGNSPYNGLNLTSGVRFPFYAAESQGTRKAAVAIATPGGPTVDQYWEDGPQLTGWGEVVARYPDGTPAIVQGSAGGGWIVLVGVHPEAPDSWRRGMTFSTPTGVDHAYAATLIDAAFRRTRLPHY